jgi:hypothetical protein
VTFSLCGTCKSAANEAPLPDTTDVVTPGSSSSIVRQAASNAAPAAESWASSSVVQAVPACCSLLELQGQQERHQYAQAGIKFCGASCGSSSSSSSSSSRGRQALWCLRMQLAAHSTLRAMQQTKPGILCYTWLAALPPRIKKNSSVSSSSSRKQQQQQHQYAQARGKFCGASCTCFLLLIAEAAEAAGAASVCPGRRQVLRPLIQNKLHAMRTTCGVEAAAAAAV